MGNIDMIKDAISDRLNIPRDFLTADTIEGNIEQAKAILELTAEQQEPQTPKEQFGEWAREVFPSEDEQDAESIMQSIRNEFAAYPSVTDKGEATYTGDPRSPKEQFAEWFGQRMQFNPRKG